MTKVISIHRECQDPSYVYKIAPFEDIEKPLQKVNFQLSKIHMRLLQVYKRKTLKI